MASILVVEDEEPVLATIGTVLKSDGHEVQLLSDCHEAYKIIQEETFDLIISDIKIGPINGLELLEQSKKLHPDTPVIMITAYATEKTREEVAALGAADFIEKAFRVDQLLEAVTKALTPTD